MSTSDTRTLAVLFADVCGSAHLRQQLGRETANTLLDRTLGFVTEEAARHSGTVVKRIGDELLCVFPTPDAAATAAQAMHARVESESASAGGPPIHLRIGMDHGDVISERGTVRGETVIGAARVTSVTRSRQILATQRVVEGLSPEAYASLEKVERTGGSQRHELYRVRWPGDGAYEPTATHDPRAADLPSRELLLEGASGKLAVDPKRWSVLLGRDGQCDLVVMGPAVSRLHCRISFALGAFTLTDTSTNGTYVRFGDETPVAVTNRSIALDRSGTLCLGTRFRDADTIVRFVLVKARPEEVRAPEAEPEGYANPTLETLALPSFAHP